MFDLLEIMPAYVTVFQSTQFGMTKPPQHRPAPDSPLTTQHWLTASRSMFWNAASDTV